MFARFGKAEAYVNNHVLFRHAARYGLGDFPGQKFFYFAQQIPVIGQALHFLRRAARVHHHDLRVKIFNEFEHFFVRRAAYVVDDGNAVFKPFQRHRDFNRV